MRYRSLPVTLMIFASCFYEGFQNVTPPTYSSDQSSLSLDEIKKNAGTDQLFDAIFYYKATFDPGDKDAEVLPFRINEVFYGNQESYKRAADLFKASFGDKTTAYTPAKSYADSVELARHDGATMNLSEKLLYLSLMGSKLSQGYSSTTTNEYNMQKIFENALKGQHQGGICGDIHRYLSDHAKALGFDAVGLHSGLWQKDASGKDGGGHFIYHFRDPQSGVYFIQNYSQLVNTGQTTMQGAVDVSTRILAPISGVSQVESSSRVNKYHAYLPQTSRWVQAHLNGFTDIKEDDPIFKLNLSNEGKTVGLQFTKKMGNDKVRGFFVHSDFTTDEGPFEMNAVGLATQSQFSRQVADSLINEYGVYTNINGGFMQIQAPSYDNNLNPMNKSRDVIFMGAKVRGYARVNRTTGRVELEVFTNDYGIKDRVGYMDSRARVGVEQPVGESNWKADYEREIEGSRNSQASRNYHPQVHYDRISVIYDNTRIGNKAALVLNSEYYIFEGVETMAATALRQVIKASYPTAQFGTISLAVDASKFISNPSKDLYYDIPFSSSIKLALEKAVNKFVDVGAQIEYGKGRPYWKLDQNITPALQRSNRLSGFIWVHMKL